MNNITLLMIYDLFSSKERIKILEFVLYRETSTVTTASQELSVSKGLVSQFLSHLQKVGILYRKMGYHPTDHVLTRAVKILLNINRIDLAKIKKKPFIRGIGLYGSWAHGTNVVNSDLDVWIKVGSYPDEKELADLVKILRQMTHTDVQLLVLSPQKLEQVKKDKPFFSSLYHGSLLLWGEPL